MGIKLSEHFNFSKLLKFTFPTIIMMIFTSLYGVVDGIFISNFAGSEPFAAINIVWPIIMLFSTVGFMVGTGGSALVSKTLGEEKKEKAKQYFSMLIYFEIIVGIIFSVIGIFTLRPISILMGAEGNILDEGVAYGKILLIPLTAFILQNSFQSFMVAAERPKLGLLITVIAGLANIFFDFLLVYVFDLGITGAAIATAISQFAGGLIPLIFFMFKNSTNYRLVKTGLEIKPIAKACLNGLSEMMMNISLSLVNMLYNYQLLKIEGPNGVIAYGIIMYVSFIFVGTFLGYSNGSAPIVSFHFGAKNTDELKNLLKRSLVIIFLGSIILTGIGEAAAPLLSLIFVGYDNHLYEFTLKAIRIYFISFIILGYNIYASAFFTGLNNGIVSAIISISRTLVFEITMIFVLPIFFGVTGIWMAVSFAELLSLIVSIVLLILNRKKYDYF
ncbi:mate-domain-containing protein [Neocallimastix lanati (nom. inval.)]|jgi:putative MATE family efflux protein|uniref:Multidrug export protein MepA n=1 Tax=Neocallimastix californiae TaxID=1754190 RepID=A0A1Y2AUF6_9FUNG|nr:mate-domain-containing protein [Neocallimastix sp. JGI-2020a]ORY26182.1 mate-domain-containing protein [Neocallimastix californiae]|eukprot:ORY26182.1 mate-domain-containing protein [Neocallimastix californiae]